MSDYLIGVANEYFSTSKLTFESNTISAIIDQDRLKSYDKCLLYGVSSFLDDDLLEKLVFKFLQGGGKSIFLGNVRDKVFANEFYGDNLSMHSLEDITSSMGKWRSKTWFSQIAKNGNFKVSYHKMKKIFMPQNIISMYSFKGIKMKYYTTMNLPAPSYKRFIDIFNSYENKPLDAILDFEYLLSKFFNVKKVTTYTNCFTALSLALQYFTSKRKKTVAVAGLSYRRTTDIVLWSGLQPIYIDNDLDTLGMSLYKLIEQLESSTIGCVLLNIQW